MTLGHPRRGLVVSLFCALALVACAGQAPIAPQPAVSACAHPWDGGKRAQAHGLDMEEVRGRDLATFVENYNAAEPPTDFAPDHLFLFSHEDVSVVLMVMVQDDCIIRTDPIPATVLPALRGGVAS